MCSDFDKTIFSFLSSMSNSELFLVREHNKEENMTLKKKKKKPILEFEDIFNISSSQHHPTHHHHTNQEQEPKYDDKYQQEEEEEEEEEESKTVDSCLGETKATEDDDDDNDGFKTPTSLDHKIPVITQCPPAPRKAVPLSTKRKASSPNVRRCLQLDLSQEVESLFPPPVRSDLHQKIKKARRDNNA